MAIKLLRGMFPYLNANSFCSPFFRRRTKTTRRKRRSSDILDGDRKVIKKDILAELVKKADESGIKRVEIAKMIGTVMDHEHGRKAAEIIGVKDVEKAYQALPIMHRLSYENFRNVKLLNAAILNFGGGSDEFDVIVERYAEASALYFRNEYVESAIKFMINERQIKRAAKKINEIYKIRTASIQEHVLKMKTKIAFKMAVAESKRSVPPLYPAIDKALNEGGDLPRRAHDYSERGYYIDSIYYYRRAKEKFLSVYTIFEAQYKDIADRSNKRSEVQFLEKMSKETKMPWVYRLDVIDNKNRVFDGSEDDKDKMRKRLENRKGPDFIPGLIRISTP